MDASHYRTLVFTITAEHPALDDTALVTSCVDAIIRTGGFTRLGDLSHRFQPSGVTMVTMLSESHLAVHTWPEQGTAKLVISTCQKAPIDPSAFAAIIRRELSASEVTYTEAPS